MIKVSGIADEVDPPVAPTPHPAFSIANKVMDEWDRQQPLRTGFLEQTHPLPIHLDMVIAAMAALAGIDLGAAAKSEECLASLLVEAIRPRSFLTDQPARKSMSQEEPAGLLGIVRMTVANPPYALSATFWFQHLPDRSPVWAQIGARPRGHPDFKHLRIYLEDDAVQVGTESSSRVRDPVARDPVADDGVPSQRSYWLLPEGVMVVVAGQKLAAGNIHAMANGRWVMRLPGQVVPLREVKIVQTPNKP